MILSLAELLDLVIMTAALGYIFMDMFKRPSANPLEQNPTGGFTWNDFWYATAVVAPSIILHEMAHKFTALYFGLEATFHAALKWLAFGIVLKLLQTGFIFFVPGYVTVSRGASALEHATIAFVGPAMHLVLWLGTWYYLEEYTVQNGRFWGLTMQVNKFLFILNMLPIPGFDGFSVYQKGLLALGVI